VSLGAAPRGLSLARETGGLLAWDNSNSLYLLNRVGELQARAAAGGALTAASYSDDGSTLVAVGARGEVWRLMPDLRRHGTVLLKHPATACALDPFGRYLAVADVGGELHVYGAADEIVCRSQTPRPLLHLAFIPEKPLLVGCADFGLVTCFDLTGRCVWRDGLVCHVGGLAVNGDGSRIILACYSDGIRSYDTAGKQKSPIRSELSSRLVALSYDGRRALVGGLGSQVWLMDSEGRVRSSHELDTVPTALALSPLADSFVAALADGRIVAVHLK
jgi:hypothetical protein